MGKHSRKSWWEQGETHSGALTTLMAHIRMKACRYTYTHTRVLKGWKGGIMFLHKYIMHHKKTSMQTYAEQGIMGKHRSHSCRGSQKYQARLKKILRKFVWFLYFTSTTETYKHMSLNVTCTYVQHVEASIHFFFICFFLSWDIDINNNSLYSHLYSCPH